MLLSCVIIDDEPLARKGMKEYIQDVEFLQLAGEFDNPMKAIELLLREKIDLLFLDIQMPKMTGVDFARSLSNVPMVIFTTAYPQYAVDGFELDAVDYLVKPFSFDRFCKAVMKARRMKESAPGVAGGVTSDESPEQDHFFIKCDNKLVRIRLDEVLFVEAMQNYVAVHTAGKKYISYLTLHGVEEFLPPGRFIRTHKSFIVAAGKVESIEGNEIRIGPHRIPISRTERESVLRQLLPKKMPKR
jgi:DNA-binding LytR/AlgR family response regulator